MKYIFGILFFATSMASAMTIELTDLSKVQASAIHDGTNSRFIIKYKSIDIYEYSGPGIGVLEANAAALKFDNYMDAAKSHNLKLLLETTKGPEDFNWIIDTQGMLCH